MINTNFMNDFILDVIAGDEFEAQWLTVLYFDRNIFDLRAQDVFYI